MLNFNSDNWWSPWSNLEAIGSIGGYYRILNGSERINPNLTNGTDRTLPKRFGVTAEMRKAEKEKAKAAKKAAKEGAEA